MRVLFDCRYVRPGRHDGISRYSAELVRALAESHDVTMLVDDDAQLQQLPTLPHILGPSHTGILEPLTAWRLRHVDVDVCFSPMQTIGTIGRRWPVVTTIHDLIYYRHPTPPKNLPGLVRALWRVYHLSFWPQRLLLAGADATATVSATTAGLMREHRLTRRPVRVVANAANALARPVTADAPASASLVYMGSFMPYKNVDALALAMRELPGYVLHLASGIDAAERDRLLALAPAGSIVAHDGVSDDEYAELLRGATALVHASRDEGFGIPLLEAMMLGIPVVVSDIPIFREVAGDAGVYADPDDPAAFARGVRQVRAEWAARSAASRAHAARFSWAASGRALGAFLAEVVAAHPRSSRT